MYDGQKVELLHKPETPAGLRAERAQAVGEKAFEASLIAGDPDISWLADIAYPSLPLSSELLQQSAIVREQLATLYGVDQETVSRAVEVRLHARTQLGEAGSYGDAA